MRPIARRALAAQSDDRLVRLIREGHEPAFEELVRRYREPLIAFSAAIVTINRAEDVVQVSLERAQKALLRDEVEIRLRPWLFAIVRNEALNVLRDEPRSTPIHDEDSRVPGPEEVVEQRLAFGALMNAVCALPPAQREALVRREMEGRGHAEIAAQLGTSATAVRGLIFRARTTLRDAVGVMVPLPILRSLLTDARVAEAMTAGGGGAAGLAIFGGGTKLSALAATAVIAVGAGTAIRGEQSGDGVGIDREAAEAGQKASEAGIGPQDTEDAGSPDLGTLPESAGATGSPNDDSPGGGGGDSDGNRDAGNDGEGGGSEPDGVTDDDSSGPSGEDDESGSDGDNDSSGPSGGEDDSSGPSGEGTDSSGSGSGADDYPAEPSDGTDDDSSGSGGGDASSGSGSDDALPDSSGGDTDDVALDIEGDDVD